MTYQIPNYTLLNKIGEGAMAEVWLAEHQINKRKAAIKILKPAALSDANAEKLFVREGQVLASFDHPNIVRILEQGRSGNLSYLVMECLSGGDLLKRMDPSSAPVTVGEALGLIVQIAGALDAAHQQQVVHRDLKPANIMLRNDTTPVLTDFGIARFLDRSISVYAQAQMIVGTVAYMSPEQVTGQELDGRSDLYALGILFFELLTGQRPFPGRGFQELAQVVEVRVAQGEALGSAVRGNAESAPVERAAPAPAASVVAPLLDVPAAAASPSLVVEPALPAASAVRRDQPEPLPAPSLVVDPAPPAASAARRDQPESVPAANSPRIPDLSRQQDQSRAAATDSRSRATSRPSHKWVPVTLVLLLAVGAGWMWLRPGVTPTVSTVVPSSSIKPTAADPAEKKRVEAAAAVEAEKKRVAEAARKAKADGRFVQAAGGMLRDTKTGLIWTQSDNGSDVNWNEARAYCAGKGLALPSVDELQAIYQSGSGTPCDEWEFTCKVSALFRLSSPRGYYWSGTANGSAEAWDVNLEYGERISSPVFDAVNGRALCVRRS